MATTETRINQDHYGSANPAGNCPVEEKRIIGLACRADSLVCALNNIESNLRALEYRLLGSEEAESRPTCPEMQDTVPEVARLQHYLGECRDTVNRINEVYERLNLL